MRIPIYFSGLIPMKTIADALHQAGIHIRTEAGCRLVAEPVPAFLRKTDTESNVVPMRTKRAKRN
jgi:hypothetical protein